MRKQGVIFLLSVASVGLTAGESDAGGCCFFGWCRGYQGPVGPVPQGICDQNPGVEYVTVTRQVPVQVTVSVPVEETVDCVVGWQCVNNQWVPVIEKRTRTVYRNVTKTEMRTVQERVPRQGYGGGDEDPVARAIRTLRTDLSILDENKADKAEVQRLLQQFYSTVRQEIERMRPESYSKDPKDKK